MPTQHTTHKKKNIFIYTTYACGDILSLGLKICSGIIAKMIINKQVAILYMAIAVVLCDCALVVRFCGVKCFACGLRLVFIIEVP